MPKIKAKLRHRLNPYKMSDEQTAENLKKFLASNLSQRRNAVVDPDNQFISNVGLPLELKNLNCAAEDKQETDESGSEKLEGGDAACAKSAEEVKSVNSKAADESTTKETQ